MLKGFLAVIGTLTLLAFVTCTGTCVWTFRQRSDLIAEAVPFVQSSNSAITSAWDRNALRDRMTPEDEAQTSEENLQRMFSVLEKKLGKLVHADEPQGDVDVRFGFGDYQAIAKYKTTARFEKGPGAILLVAVKRDERWYVRQFHVDSPLLAE